MSESLIALECPECHATLRPRPGQPGPASCYDDCLRRCDACGIGFSNARRSPVKIVSTVEKSVPPDVHDGLARALDHAVNKTNARNKRAKFAFETSEDAVTWTVFRRLQMRERLRSMLHAAGVLASPAGAEPAMLLWGAPVPHDDPRATALGKRLATISAALGEDPLRRTEPDVVLDLGEEGVVVIEVKVLSGNEVNAAGRWKRYLSDTCFADVRLGEASGLYELARNWRFAHDLAGGRPFALVNLGPRRLFSAPEIATFSHSLATGRQGQFVTVTWESLVETPDIARDAVLSAFLGGRLDPTRVKVS